MLYKQFTKLPEVFLKKTIFYKRVCVRGNFSVPEIGVSALVISTHLRRNLTRQSD